MKKRRLNYLLSQKLKINQLVKDFQLDEAKPTHTNVETNYYFYKEGKIFYHLITKIRKFYEVCYIFHHGQNLTILLLYT